MGGEPGNEAHGGYTYCGVAALALADSLHSIDLPRLLHWAVMRQGHVEGGFNGRTNKLVDGCYSLWVGGLFPLLQRCASHQLLRSPAVRPDPGQASEPPCCPDVAMEPAAATDAAGCEEQRQQQQLQERTQPERHQQDVRHSTVRSDAVTQQAPCDSAAVQMDVDPVEGAPAGSTQPCGAETGAPVHTTTTTMPGLQQTLQPRTRRPVRKVLPLPPLHIMDPVTEVCCSPGSEFCKLGSLGQEAQGLGVRGSGSRVCGKENWRAGGCA